MVLLPASLVRRVARIITRLNIGGPSIQAIDLSRDLAANGFETCLIHGRLSPGEGDMTTLLPLGNIETVYVADLTRPVSPLRDLRAAWRIYRALCRWRPDIVHTHMAKAGALGVNVKEVVHQAASWKRIQGERRPRLVRMMVDADLDGLAPSKSTAATARAGAQ